MREKAAKAYRPKVAVMAAMAQGRRRVDRGDLKGAARWVDRAVALDSSSVQAYLYRAGLRLLTGDDAGALSDFHAIAGLDHARIPAYRDLTTMSAEEFPRLLSAVDRILALDPACAWAYVFRAFSLRSLMRYEEAVLDLDQALRCAPGSAGLYAMRSRVKLTNRQALYEGVRDMETAIRLAPRWGWLHCWLGEALRHQGEQRRALAALDRGLRLDPAYKRGSAWRGGVKVALGMYRSALRDLELSLRFDPIYSYDFEYTADQKSWAFNQKMLARRGLGDTAGAVAELNQAHRFGPRYTWMFNPEKKAVLFERAVGELRALLETRPRHLWARAWLGWTRFQWGLQEEALADLEQVTRQAPRLSWPWCWKGKVLLSLGRAKAAQGSLDRGLRLDAAYSPAWGWRAEARRSCGDLRGAADDFSQALKLDHRAAWAYAGRGECALAQGLISGALHDLDRALAICPDYAEALGWRAEARRLDGNLAGALKDADEALRLKPGLVLVYLTRSLLKQALQDFEGQVADFNEAARLDPGLLERV